MDDGRIEGYLPYDEFVFRRLGTTFEFIDRLGKRYEQAKRDIMELSQSMTQGDILRQNKAIEKMQKMGERALFFVLLPYYLSHLSTNLLGVEKCDLERVIPLERLERIIPPDKLGQTIWIAATIFCLGLYITLREKKISTWWFIAAIAGAASLIGFFYSYQYFF